MCGIWGLKSKTSWKCVAHTALPLNWKAKYDLNSQVEGKR